MKKVMFYEWEQPEGRLTQPKERISGGQALFHCFGVDCEKIYETGVGSYTTAIIELATGEMKNIPVEDIVFIPDADKERNPKKGRETFEKLARPLVKFLNDNYHPHTSVIITTDHAKVVSDEFGFPTEDYLLD